MEAVEKVASWITIALSFIQTWGAIILSALSLIVAIISIAKSTKAQKLQNKVNEIELKLKEYELDKVAKAKEAANSALVQARIIRMGKDNYRLKIWNSGGGTAYNVKAKFEDDPNIIVMDLDKLPFEELESQKSFELILIVHFGSAHKAKVLTEWDNADGSRHSKSQMVDF